MLKIPVKMDGQSVALTAAAGNAAEANHDTELMTSHPEVVVQETGRSFVGTGDSAKSTTGVLDQVLATDTVTYEKNQLSTAIEYKVSGQIKYCAFSH